MSDEPVVEPKSTQTTLKTSLDVSVTMVLITSSEYMGEDYEWWQKIMRILAPLFGLIISSLVVYLFKNYEDNKNETLVQGYIDGLDTKLQVPRLSPARKNELQQQRDDFQKTLSEIRLKKIKRRMM